MSLATFVLNANEHSRFGQEVYVVCGWDSAFIDGTLAADQEYETYVKMVSKDKDFSVGYIAVMKEIVLIGSIRGVRVQRVPRRLMDVMFKPKGDTRTDPTPSIITPLHQESNINKASKPHMVAANPAKIQKALHIIAEESGIALSDLKDDDFLVDISIDSLLILVIASRFRKELQVDLQPNSFAEIIQSEGLKRSSMTRSRFLRLALQKKH